MDLHRPMLPVLGLDPVRATAAATWSITVLRDLAFQGHVALGLK
jgi:hypothetical protein